MCSDLVAKVGAIRAAVVLGGGLAKFSKQVGVTRQAVGHWLRQGYVPDRHVAKVVEMTGIPASELVKGGAE